MKFTEGSIYHVYNRGNNKRPIFFLERNYIYFIEKMVKYISPSCDLLAWTLMPNHFHFLVYANASTCRIVKNHPVEINALTEGIRLLLSSYTKGIQIQQGFVGNLFQQKTKAKCVNDPDFEYSSVVFHYIHQNAYRAGLVSKLENWKYSSLSQYSGLSRTFSLCNMGLARELLELNVDTILGDTYCAMSDEQSIMGQND